MLKICIFLVQTFLILSKGDQILMQNIKAPAPTSKNIQFHTTNEIIYWLDRGVNINGKPAWGNGDKLAWGNISRFSKNAINFWGLSNVFFIFEPCDLEQFFSVVQKISELETYAKNFDFILKLPHPTSADDTLAIFSKISQTLHESRMNLNNSRLIIADTNENNIWQMFSFKNRTKFFGQTIPDLMHFVQHKEYYQFWVEVAKNDFGGAQVLMGTLDAPDYHPIVHVAPSPEIGSELKPIGGILVNVVVDLEKMLNFKIKILNQVGIMDEDADGNPTGSGYFELRDGVYDVQLFGRPFKEYQPFKTTLLHPLYTQSVVAFFMQPSSGELNSLYLSPFQKPLWTTFLLLIITFFLISLLLTYLYSHFNPHKFKFNLQSQAFESFSQTLAIISIKSVWRIPTFNSGRLLFAPFILFCVFVFNIYSANIYTTLSTAIIPIRNFGDIIKFGYTLGVLDFDQDMKIYLKGLKKFLNQNDGNKLVGPRELYNFTFSSSQPRGALLGFPELYFKIATSKNGWSNESRCAVNQVIVDNVKSKFGILAGKPSPLKEPINQKIIMLKERGLNYKYQKLFEEESGVFCNRIKSPFDPIQIEDILSVVVAVSISYLVSILIFVIERIIYLHTHRIVAIVLVNQGKK